MASKLKKAACIECRQQKAKCDVPLDGSHPCSRCQRMGKQCDPAGDYQRQHKRKRLIELENETHVLRRRLQASHTPAQKVGEVQPNSRAHAPYLQQASPTITRSGNLVSSSSARGPTSVSVAAEDDSVTLSRSLGELVISAQAIDELFSIFFAHYAIQLPILDDRINPNDCYRQSPLLFWAIVGTACRSYSADTTITRALCPKLLDMALLSVTSRQAPLQRIQAFILILTWSYPNTATSSDQDRTEVAFVLAGMLLHLAMKAGLHVAQLSSDFAYSAATNGVHESNETTARKAELWAMSVITYQRTFLVKGALPRASYAVYPHEPTQRSLSQALSPMIRLQARLQDTLIQCCAAVTEHGLCDIIAEQESSLSILIRSFEAQVKSMQMDATSAIDRMECNVTMLQIQGFYIFLEGSSRFAEYADVLVKSACQTIRSVDTACQSLDSLATVTMSVIHALALSTVLLLRISKSAINLSRGHDEVDSCFLHGMSLLKQTSTDNGDISMKSWKYFTQLWNSPDARNESGTTSYSWTRRTRNRLVASPMIDAIFWWRERFDPSWKPVTSAHGVSKQATTTDDSQFSAPTDPVQLENTWYPPIDFDNDLSFFDLDWTFGGGMTFPDMLTELPTSQRINFS